MALRGRLGQSWPKVFVRTRRGREDSSLSGLHPAPAFIPALEPLPDGPVGATVRAVAHTAPATLTLVRHRAQPTAVFIARLTATSALAYLAALALPVSHQPVLAPLTALLVVQATMYQTIRSAFQRVASVVAGVVVAVTFAAVAGFTWWSLAIVIAVGLVIGQVLRLGNHLLEVPISAMLILSVDTRAAATGRITETLVGAAAGMLGGLIFAPLRLQPAEEAIEDLSRQLAMLLDAIAGDLAAGAAAVTAGEHLSQARALGREIQRVDRALAEAEDSLRLNPRAWSFPHAASVLRGALESLEHAATTMRGLARSVADASQVDGGVLRDPPTRECLASVLRQLAAAARTFGRLVRADILTSGPAGTIRRQFESDLAKRLAAARQDQNKLAEVLRAEPAAGKSAWPLRGELLTHLSRLADELQPEHRARAREQRPRRAASWPLETRAARLSRISRRPLLRHWQFRF